MSAPGSSPDTSANEGSPIPRSEPSRPDRQGRPSRRPRRISPALVAGAILTGLIIAAALFAPVLAPADPNAQNLTGGLLPPSSEHWLGTDQLGRDVLSRMLFAAQTDLRLAVLAALAPFVIGVSVGLVSGYFGGATDWVASRVTDTVIAFPFYVIVIAIVFAVGAGEGGIIIAFAIVGWVGYARVLRAMTAALRESGWVQAARGGALSHARVLLRHVLPNVLPQAIVLLATEIVLIMVAIVTLGYLGLGIQPPTPDWGTMIADSQQFITTQWWLPAFPGVAVVVTGIAFSLLGDGVADALRIGPAPVSVARGRRRAAARSAGVALGGSGSPSPTRARIEPGTVTVHGLTLVVAHAAVQSAPLVDGLDLEVAPGAALGIVGESGSGKSLTLRAILGMLPSGVGVAGGAVAVSGTVGMVFQDSLTALDPLTRVGVQLREAVRAAHGTIGADARVRELLAAVRLPDPERMARSYPHQLSGGQRQRIVIAMALAGDPAVLLCDEPTTALDVTVQREVLDLLAELRRTRGLTLIFVSHDLAVVAQMCERMLVMRGGRLVESGDSAEIVRRPRAPYTRELLTAVPRLPLPGPRVGVAQNSSGAAPPLDQAPPRPNSLEVRNGEIRYSGSLAVTGASLAVPRGGALGIVGESGSGKTSLARALAGQLRLSAGEILSEGVRIGAHRSRAQLREIQLVPQDPTSSLNPRLTVGQTLRELLRVHRIVPRARVDARVAELLGLVRLDPALAAAHPHELSGGQRQRVALARALAVEPRILIADEPTSALDVSVQASVIALLQELRRDLGLSIVCVSHDLAVVHELCDSVIVMREGRIVEAGGREIFRGPRSSYGRALISAVPRLPDPELDGDPEPDRGSVFNSDLTTDLGSGLGTSLP